MNIRVIALPTNTVQRVLATHKSPGYGHPAHTELATGHGPCRHCLKPFRIGEEHRTLFTCNPFHNLAEIPLPGPVFIHATLCERFQEDVGHPTELLTYPAVMDAYDASQNLILQRRATNSDQPAILDELLSNEAVRYVLVRDLEAGCYDFRVERK
jgi:Protein of unknown function (DUF1203)